jgi:putative RecB family exonuclease
MEIYSHSRLSTFEQCPLKFKYRYIDKIIPEIEKSIEAHLGSLVHDALEWLYIQIKEKKETPSIDEIITYYATKWEETYDNKIRIVKKEFTSKDYFNKGINFLINYYMKHKPFKDNTLEVEKRIVINLDEKGEYKLQGFIDRLVYNLEKKEYEIHDYKTANNLPSREKIKEDRQLALYSIAIKEIHGKEVGITLVWHYLAHNMKITSKRTNQELEKLKQETLELIKKIEDTTYFPSGKSILCNWCEYKSMCPEFGGEPNERQKEILDFKKDKDKKLDIF